MRDRGRSKDFFFFFYSVFKVLVLLYTTWRLLSASPSGRSTQGIHISSNIPVFVSGASPPSPFLSSPDEKLPFSFFSPGSVSVTLVIPVSSQYAGIFPGSTIHFVFLRPCEVVRRETVLEVLSLIFVERNITLF